MKRPPVSLFTIALILDFASPQTQSLVKEPFSHPVPLAVYPLRAKDPKNGPSSCDRPLEKFIGSHQLASWIAQLKPDPQAKLPVAAALRKIAFDLQFGLHSIDHIIIDTPLSDPDSASGTKDGCGEDVCNALSGLERAAEEKKQRIRLLALTPLACRLPARSRIVLEDSRPLSLAAVVKKAQIPFHREPQVDGLVTPGTIQSVAQGTLELRGPPFQIRLEQESGDSSAPIVLRVPGSAKLKPGRWRISVISPSWISSSGLSSWDREIKNGERVSVDLEQAVGDRVSWIQSAQDSDLVVEIDAPPSLPPRILIPQGSQAVPVPKTAIFQVYRVNER